MNKEKALDILRTHNEWRRGADISMQDPKELGEAIDIAISVLEQDLALTWQDVSILITIYEAGIDNGDYRRYNDAEWMKEYSQDILRKFNEIRKK